MERGWKRHQRLWLFSGVLVFGVGLTVLPAAADGVDTAPPATTADTVSTPISHATNSDVTTDQSVTVADSVTHHVSTTGAAVAPTNAAANNVTSRPTATVTGSDSTTVPVNKSPTTSTAPLAQQSHVAAPVAKPVMATQRPAYIHVDQDNFTQYFDLNGSATYDKLTGIVTVTPDKNDQVGNFALKPKIDASTNFTLLGQVNLGNRTSATGGADGIGFAFHNGNSTDIGNAGGNLGIGGLIDALGFKLDTWHNGAHMPEALRSGAQVSTTDANGYGWANDPDPAQFGGFVTTTDQQIKAIDGHAYDRWWAQTDFNSVQALQSNDLNGQFHNFKVSYDGQSRELQVTYEETNGHVLTWTKLTPVDRQAFAMVVSASTGGAKNLQQFKLESFDFQQAATMNVRYVDLNGRQLAQATVNYPDGAVVNGTYATSQLDISGYHFVNMGDNPTTGISSPANGYLNRVGDNGTVIYVYDQNPVDYATTTRVVHEMIHYLNEQQQVIALSYQAQPITFLQVKDPTNGSISTYYSLGNNGVPLLNAAGQPLVTSTVRWIPGEASTFSPVTNPNVQGYQAVSTDALNSNLSEIAAQMVTTTSKDLDLTVYYQSVIAPTMIPDKPSEPAKPDLPQVPIVPSEPGKPAEPVIPQRPIIPSTPVKPTPLVVPTTPAMPTKPVVPSRPSRPDQMAVSTKHPTRGQQPKRVIVSTIRSRSQRPVTTLTDKQVTLPQTNENVATVNWWAWILVIGGWLGSLIWWRRSRP